MIRCEYVAGRGRFVVAATDIAAGSLIFKEDAYCVAQRVVDAKHPRCIYCCGDARNPLSTCKQCGSAYCSEACAAHHSSSHAETGECCATILAKAARGIVPEEDMDTFEMLCLILAKCASEGKAGRLRRTAPPASAGAFETVGFGQECASPLEFLNTGASPAHVFKPTYDYVECLGTNTRDTSEEIVQDFSTLFDLFEKVLQKKKFAQRARSLEHVVPCDVSRDTFVAICNAFLCNGFGIWSAVNHQLGVALYPQSSYFNHSCAPNMGRRNCTGSRVIEFFAARDIEAGEPLCISYIDLKLPAAERKAKLMATYSFECMCIRCAPDADYITANTVCSGCVPALCGGCISKVMQPLGNGLYVCPCCNQTQEAS